MPRKRDYIDEIISQGARVLPPKTKPEPVLEPAAVPIVQPEPVAEAVARLQKQWHNPDPQETTPEISVTGYGDYEEGPEPMLGDILDFVVVAFSRTDPTGQNRGGAGLARIHRGPERRGKKRTDGCYFKDSDVISEGVETLKPGSKIRARLAEAISTAHPFTLKDVEIYRG